MDRGARWATVQSQTQPTLSLSLWGQAPVGTRIPSKPQVPSLPSLLCFISWLAGAVFSRRGCGWYDSRALTYLRIALYCSHTQNTTWLFSSPPCSMQDLSSPTRDQTHAPCNGSTESQSLDHQGSPQHGLFQILGSQPFLPPNSTDTVFLKPCRLQ